MTNKEYMERAVKALEGQFGADVVRAYFWAFHDVVVLDETSCREDNAFEPEEQPQYDLYRNGAIAAEKLMRDLCRVQLETHMLDGGGWRN
jgi:hypothetical protein